MIQEGDVALTLLELVSIKVSKSDADKQLHEAVNLMLPMMVPLVYGEHDEHVIMLRPSFFGSDI